MGPSTSLGLLAWPPPPPLLFLQVKLLPVCMSWPPPVCERDPGQILSCCSKEVEAWASGPASLRSRLLTTLPVAVGFKRIKPSKLELCGLEVLNHFLNFPGDSAGKRDSGTTDKEKRKHVAKAFQEGSGLGGNSHFGVS